LLAVTVFAACTLVAHGASGQFYTVTNITNDYASHDISATGTALTGGASADDNEEVVNFPGGFTFTFYGTVYTAVTVNSNGWVYFGAAQGMTALQMRTPPASAPLAAVPNRYIAGCYDDLNPASASSDNVYVERRTTPTDRFIIHYNNIVTFASTTLGTQFVIVLYASGTIEIHYSTGQTHIATPIAVGTEDDSGTTADVGPNGFTTLPTPTNAFRWALPAGPEINLQRGTTSIASGGTDNIGSGSAGTPIALTYTVQNLGTTNPLTVSGIATQGTPTNCSISYGALTPASPVPAANSATFGATVTPTAPGVFSATFVVTNNDTNEGTYTVTIQGIVTNDSVANAVTLTLNQELAGTTASATNDYQIQAASTKFIGVTHTVTTAPGRDVVYSFTAPSAGNYSFRTHFGFTSNVVIYLIDFTPTGTAPITINDANIIAAANRNTSTSNAAEELFNVALSASQQVFLIVDEVTLTAGGAFAVEVSQTSLETEPNGTTATASANPHGKTGSLGTAADIDFYDLGTPGAGSRVFAMTDSAGMSSMDTLLRVTTNADTLESDDDGGDVAFAGLSSVVAGTPTTGTQTYLRVNLLSTTALSEPYRLYAVVQPHQSLATAEAEPNENIGQASTGSNNYFSGVMAATTDVDIYSFTATLGDLIFIAADFDPARTNLPWNGILTILDSTGAVLLQVNDGGATSSTTSGAGNLASATPNSPADGLVWRARTTGTYYARVTYSGGTAGRAYLLSISKNGMAEGNTAPAITSTAPANGLVGTAYSHQFVATGAPTFFTWSVSAGSLPGGLTLDANSGLLSGTPTASGNFNFTVQASNGFGAPATQVVAMDVNEAPLFTSSPVTSGATGVAYTYTPTASGFPAPSISVTSTLPGWLTFTGGTLSGTPQASDFAGSPYTIDLDATNSAGTDVQSFQITLTLSNLAPRGNPETAVSVPVFTGTADSGPFAIDRDPGASVSSAIIIDDADATDMVQVVTINAPATNIGVTAAASTGAFATTVDVDFTGSIIASVAPGVYTWTIDITDDATPAGTRTITVNITVNNIAPDGFTMASTGTSGDGIALGSAYTRSFNQTTTVAATDLFDVTDANTGQTLSITSSIRTGGATATSFPFTGQFAIAGSAGSFTVSVSTVGALVATDVGTHEHEVVITDGTSPITVFVTITVIAQTPPTITANATGVSIGQGGSMSAVNVATVSDAQDAATALSVTATSVPTGITVSAISVDVTGVVTCTITVGAAVAPGATALGFTVTDTFSLTDVDTYNFTVLLNNLPTITAGTAITMGVNVTLTARTIATVSDVEDAAGTLTVATTVVPPGITIGTITNTTGTITADVTSSPTIVAGVYNVTLQVTDSQGATNTANLQITISTATGGGGGGGDDGGGGCVAGNGSSSWMAMLAVLGLFGLATRLRRARA